MSRAVSLNAHKPLNTFLTVTVGLCLVTNLANRGGLQDPLRGVLLQLAEAGPGGVHRPPRHL